VLAFWRDLFVAELAAAMAYFLLGETFATP
jgi:hypothetical protein